MNQVDTISKLQLLFAFVLDKPDVVITAETNTETLPEWDSLAHIHLIVEVENTFGIVISAEEMRSIVCVADLLKLIAKTHR